MSRMLPPHTIVGIDGSSIIGDLVHRAAESAATPCTAYGWS